MAIIVEPMVTYEEFKKIEVRAGKILSAEKIPDTDKLLKLSVDFAEKNTEGGALPRQIISGISLHFPDPAVLVGKTYMFVTNLEPRTIRGFESNGMIFAVSNPASGDVGPDGVAANPAGFSLLQPNSSIPPGSLAA